MRSAAWVLLLCASCIQDATVVCGDLRCAVGSVCTPGGCATPEQVAACDGLADEETCEAPGLINGHCLGGGCQDSICGNDRIEFGEVCDDGNVDGKDGCGPRCDSLEVCGNGVVDVLLDEQCDDQGAGRSLDGCTSACTVELDTWREVTPRPMAPRTGVVAAYDSHREVVVLFGGSDNPVDLRDTWELANDQWAQRIPIHAPPSRSSHAMAYDAMHRRTIMFGGISGADFLDDTWLWDGVDWTEIQGPRPSPRVATALAYLGNGTTLLFGGNAPDGSLLADTWLFDGTQWSQLSPSTSPEARWGHSMARDELTGDVVLYGGAPMGDDTWVFANGNWSERNPAANAGSLYAHRMVFDATRGRVVIVGGKAYVTGTAPTNVFAWNGTTWSSVGTLTGVGTRSDHALVFDTANDRLVVFGGLSSSGVDADTWAFTTAWTELAQERPSPRAISSAVFDAARGDVIMFGGFSPLGAGVLADTWRWDGMQWLNARPQTAPSARYGHSMTFDSKRGIVVLFGGLTSSSTTPNEMWSWNGETWAILPAATTRPGRGGAAMAYDVDRDRIVMFGGLDVASMVQSDTWEWDGTGWTMMTPATSPPPVSFATMTYDRIGKKMMLHGGIDGETALTNDTWAWDGVTWTKLTPATKPAYGELLYSELRQRVLLVAADPAKDPGVWEWTGTDWTQRAVVLAPTTTGAGITTYDNRRGRVVRFGDELDNPNPPTWSYGFESASYPPDTCTDADSDNDGLVGCMDPDCAPICDPLCNVGYCGADRPGCGDGVCSSIEDPLRCASDCM